MTDARNSLLVLVHPGSACGSANANLGRFDARAARSGLVSELAVWTGGLLVIDGSLSDELDGYPHFAEAITLALDRAKVAGAISLRVFGSDDNDFNQTKATQAFLAEHALDPATSAITLTGAWYDDSGLDGCVNDVERVFLDRGYRCEISECALSLPEGLDEDEEPGDGPSEGFSP